MSEYAERFAENEISVAALRHLTDQDLKDTASALGIGGKVLAAIAALNGMAAVGSAHHHRRVWRMAHPLSGHSVRP